MTVTLEGRRPLAAEIQALVAPTMLSNPRRTTSGVDSSRLAMVLAVLQRRGGLLLADKDVYASTVGGARVVEPAADLALALAIAGSADDVAATPHLVAFGEVGLAGEVRGVLGLPRRLAEARRLGFTTAVVPADAIAPRDVPDGLTVLEARDVRQAVRLARGQAGRDITRPIDPSR